ncbi:MAG TPA: response regulator [Chthonomonadaceae bacterium]|nr:response regulator [Chthonomonadaceae bacterium]
MSLTGKRIVVVDDEGDTNLSLRQDCEQAGMIVVGLAYNGKAGVEIALEQRPDIVLMDSDMPVMGGVEAARSLLAQIPVCVVMLSPCPDPTDTHKGLSLGVHGVLTKPIRRESLLPALEKAFACFQQSREAVPV